MSHNIEQLRQEYKLHELTETDTRQSPFDQFGIWFKEASAVGNIEPNAMALATANAGGAPSVRMVLLKGFSAEGGFLFYTNYDSRKGQELLANPHASLLFWWPELERQVRIEGAVAKAPTAVSDAYFNSRPAESRLGAIASPQSQVIASREALEANYRKLQEEFPYGNVSRPEHWGGFSLQPSYFEFWQGRPSRLHDRIAYSPEPGGNWHRKRLAP